MVRLLTHVDEAVVDGEPPKKPLDWFRTDGCSEKNDCSNVRYLLFLGFDAGREENKVESMQKWMTVFQEKLLQEKLSSATPPRLAATVFVLDWPRTPWSGRNAPKLKDEEIGNLMRAGICYRPKDDEFYKSGVSFAQSLRNDLKAKHLIPDDSAGEAVPPKPWPDNKSSYVREAIRFLGSREFGWPAEAVRQLFNSRRR